MIAFVLIDLKLDADLFFCLVGGNQSRLRILDYLATKYKQHTLNDPATAWVFLLLSLQEQVKGTWDAHDINSYS